MIFEKMKLFGVFVVFLLVIKANGQANERANEQANDETCDIHSDNSDQEEVYF